jgi:hypothetical protein
MHGGWFMFKNRDFEDLFLLFHNTKDIKNDSSCYDQVTISNRVLTLRVQGK